jgi:hypothetical protein
VRTRAPDLPPEQPGDDGADQRRKRYGEVEFFHHISPDFSQGSRMLAQESCV